MRLVKVKGKISMAQDHRGFVVMENEENGAFEHFPSYGKAVHTFNEWVKLSQEEDKQVRN